METIIINKQYFEGSELLTHKKRIILYNENGEVLVYKRKKGLYIPSVLIKEETNFEEEIKENVNIDFDVNNIEELIRIIDCKFRYNSVNYKLIKKHLQQIRDYYACLANFDKNMEDSIEPIITDGDKSLPKIMDIQEVIDYLKQFQPSNSKVRALEVLKQKVKGKKYEGQNKII